MFGPSKRIVKETSWTNGSEEFLLENFSLGLSAGLGPILGSADFQNPIRLSIHRPASLLFFFKGIAVRKTPTSGAGITARTDDQG